MVVRPALALAFALVACAGCLEGFAGADAAELPPDDGTVAWLLPAGSELPPHLRLADDETARRFLNGTNPGPPNAYAWRSIKSMVDEPQVPQDVVAAVYQREDEPRHVVVVVAARFERDQEVMDWRTYGEAFGMPAPGEPAGRPDDDSDNDYDIFWSICGLRARYGFVRGHDALLVLGNLDVTGNTPPGRGVRGPALELEATLRDRAAGEPICMDKERAIHRHLAVEEGSLSPGRVAADGLEGVELGPAAGEAPPATATAATATTAAFAPPGAEPLVEGSARHGPLAPGETQWFSFEVVRHSCLYMGFHGEMGRFEILDESGEPADLGWSADRRDGAYGFNQDLYDAGRFFLQVQAYPEGSGVDELWVALTPDDCPPPR